MKANKTSLGKGERAVKRKDGGISQEVLCGEYEAVFRYVLTLCPDRAEAEDITQETFLKALKAAHSFQGKSSLYTWLCAIAKNHWLTRQAKKKREVAPSALEHTLASGDKPLDQQAVERDLSMRIHQVLHQLEEPYKEVFSLRVFGQLSFGDIASLFAKSDSWARVTYHRAKKKILQQLRKDGML